jgi:hypothetical protein
MTDAAVPKGALRRLHFPDLEKNRPCPAMTGGDRGTPACFFSVLPMSGFVGLFPVIFLKKIRF